MSPPFLYQTSLLRLYLKRGIKLLRVFSDSQNYWPVAGDVLRPAAMLLLMLIMAVSFSGAG